MATLHARNLTKSYGGRTVLRDVSLNVTSGEIVGLLGPNGAGKTTTFYLVVGLTAPDAGEVTLNGEVVFDKSELGRYPALPDSKEMKAKVINIVEAVTV